MWLATNLFSLGLLARKLKSKLHSNTLFTQILPLCVEKGGKLWVQKLCIQMSSAKGSWIAPALFMKYWGELHVFQQPRNSVFPFTAPSLRTFSSYRHGQAKIIKAKCMKEKPFVTILFLVSVSLLFLAPWVVEAAQPLSLWEPTSLLKYVYMLQCQPLKAKRVGYRTSLDMRTTPHVLAFFS